MVCAKMTRYRIILKQMINWYIAILIIGYVGKSRAQSPAQMEAPNITFVSATAINITFEVGQLSEYIVTATPRYGSTPIVLRISNRTDAVIASLASSTLYDISIQAVNPTGDIGIAGKRTAQQTNPGAPILRASTPLPNAFLLFLETKNRARVTQFTVQYRIESDSNVTTHVSEYYVLRLLGLQPDTTYEVRGRCSQIYGNVDLNENEAVYSNWYKFKTDSLSVFGRVDLAERNFTNTTEWSADWNWTLQVINSAYDSLTNLNSINIVSLEEGTGTVYYELKVKDKSFTSTATSTYLLNGSGFTDSAVNNGDQPIGIPALEVDTYQDWNFSYTTNTTITEGRILKAYMLVSPEGKVTEPILVPPIGDNEEGRRIMSFRDDTGKYAFDDGESPGSYSFNTVIGFEPKYLIRDFLKNQPTELLYSIIYEMPGNNVYRFIRTTDLNTIDLSTVTYSTSRDGSVVLSFPSIDKSTEFYVTGNGSVGASLPERDIDGSSRLSLLVPSLANESLYELALTVTQRKHDGVTTNVTSRSFFVSTELDRCSRCSENAVCETAVESGSTTCICSSGFEGDGSTCMATTTLEPTPPLPSTPSTAVTTTEATTATETTSAASTATTTSTTAEKTSAASTSTAETTSAASTSTATTTPTTAETTSAASTATMTSTAAETTSSASTSTATTTSTTAETTSAASTSTATTTSTTAETTSAASTATMTSTAAETTSSASTTISTTLGTTSIVITTTSTTTIPDCVFESNDNVSFVPHRVNNSSMLLTWNNVSADYAIQVQCIDCADETWYNRTVSPEITLEGLRSGELYNICVIAEMCKSGVIQNKTQCNTFLSNPSSVKNVAIDVGPSSVVISWDAVLGASLYSVSWNAVSSIARASLNKEGRRETSDTNITLYNLYQCETYDAALTAINEGGESSPTRAAFNTSCATTAPSITTEFTTQVTSTAVSQTMTLTDTRSPDSTTPKPSSGHTVSSDSGATRSWTISQSSAVSISGYASTATSQPLTGTPWWFILAIVLAIIIAIACIAAIIWVRKGKKHGGMLSVQLVAARQRRASQNYDHTMELSVISTTQPERTKV